MKTKKILTAMSALVLAAFFSGCIENSSSSEEELIPPTPAECGDPNAITFDDGDFSFADIMVNDPDSAQGELQIVEYDGNPMLAFVDSGTNFADGTVQKIKFDAAKLLSPEDLAKVYSIEADIYATATAEDYVNEDKENLKAPGWIGGGGGANVSGDKWYDFSEWSGGEYNFEKSGPVHIELKFLLASSGKCWDETMEEAVFQIMRWGAQNEGDLMIDNIVFKDKNGDSLPVTKSDASEEKLTPGDMAR